MRDFDKYVASQTPLPWTIIEDHPTSWLNGNHSLAVNFVRFKLIMEAVDRYYQSGATVLDLGAYPGHLPKIFHEYYPRDEACTYYGCGLGFDDEFRSMMETFRVQLLECDLDPRLGLQGERLTRVPLEDEKVDICFFTDAIEHFYDPFYPLTEINRVCRLGGILILTTDNLSRLGSIFALMRGKSCNVPLIASSLFYEGDWRPHFREYSKDELLLLLNWAGFDILSHQFFEAEFGSYKAVCRKLTRVDKKGVNWAGKIKKTVRKAVVNLVPRLRDNQIIIAEKKVDYMSMIKNSPKVTADRDKWISQRKAFN